MGGQQAKERHPGATGGSGTITRSTRMNNKYRSEREIRAMASNVFSEHSGKND